MNIGIDTETIIAAVKKRKIDCIFLMAAVASKGFKM